MLSPADIQARLGQTLVNFASRGIFPDEEAVSAATVEDSALPAALIALNDAKAELEKEVHQISRDSAPDVDLWIDNAKSLLDDIEASRRLAGDIVQQATAEERREETIREKETYEEFLTSEASFTVALLEALRLIQEVNNCLDNAETLLAERRILEALRMLTDAWKSIAEVPTEKNTRAIRLLDQRCSDLRATAHEHLLTLWDHLVLVDFNNQILTINQSLSSVPGTLDDAINGLKDFKELDQTAHKLWQALDKMILAPRTNISLTVLPSITITKNSIGIGKESVEPTIKSLFNDLEAIIRFLSSHLPEDIIVPLSEAMMPGLSAHIKEVWLNAAVPSSLDDMVMYQKALAQVAIFAKTLKDLEWPGEDTFNDWVSNASKIWLSKKREDALDWVRNELSLGIGAPQQAQLVETRMVETREDTSANTDWDAAWNSDDDDEPSTRTESETASRNKHSLDEERRNAQVAKPSESPSPPPGVEDDTADAWGWGDEDEVDSPVPEESRPTAPVDQSHLIAPRQTVLALREITMTEDYWTSSLPRPIMNSITQIFNDGATLLKPENDQLPVAPAAAALFVLPTLILAMYRSVGPLYYGYHPSGNMFLYNDTLWLTSQLRDFVTTWKIRDDLPPRATTMVRLDSEIFVLESFGRRAYASELNAQRTVINDLLGGTQNFFQDGASDLRELETRIDNVIGHIRSKAESWGKILSDSALACSLGSLVNTVAIRLINDVFDMSSMSVAEAESTATVISLVERLDDMFVPKQKNGKLNGLSHSEEPIPLTAQFADKWMKMKYLSQTLQSNLNDIKYLWFEGELSLYFAAAEVIDLIELSFENNAGVRNLIRQIRERPHPI